MFRNFTVKDLELILLKSLYQGNETSNEDLRNSLRIYKGVNDLPHQVYELLIENADVNNSLRNDIRDKLHITYQAKPNISTANTIISNIISRSSFKNKLKNLTRKLDIDEINNVNNKLNQLKQILDRANLHIDSSSDLVYSSEDNVKDSDELIAKRKYLNDKLRNKQAKIETYNNIIDQLINNRLNNELINSTLDIDQTVKQDTEKLTLFYDDKIKQLLEDNASLKESEKQQLISKLNREKQEALQQLKASEYAKLNKLVAETKHKAEEYAKNQAKNQAKDDSKDTVKIINKSADFQQLVKDSYYNNDYKLSDQELFNTLISRGKTKAEAKELVKAIRLNSINMLLKDKKKIATLATIGKYDLSSLSNMSPEIQQEINDAIITKQREIDNTRNLKYKLPVQYIDYKNKQVVKQHVNPMLFRGAYKSLN